MKRILRKLASNKIGFWALMIMIGMIAYPTYIAGRILYAVSKIIKALSYLLMFKTGSFMDELSDWSVEISLKDIF